MLLLLLSSSFFYREGRQWGPTIQGTVPGPVPPGIVPVDYFRDRARVLHAKSTPHPPSQKPWGRLPLQRHDTTHAAVCEHLPHWAFRMGDSHSFIHSTDFGAGDPEMNMTLFLSDFSRPVNIFASQPTLDSENISYQLP